MLSHTLCGAKDCPMLIFADPLARELNAFLQEDEWATSRSGRRSSRSCRWRCGGLPKRGDVRLMRELENAEDRLISSFMNGWSDHATMSFAYSHYRRALLRCIQKNKS